MHRGDLLGPADQLKAVMVSVYLYGVNPTKINVNFTQIMRKDYLSP